MLIDISTLPTIDIFHNVLLISLYIYSIVLKLEWEIPWSKSRPVFQAMRGAEQQLRAAEVQPGPGDLEFSIDLMAI